MITNNVSNQNEDLEESVEIDTDAIGQSILSQPCEPEKWYVSLLTACWGFIKWLGILLFKVVWAIVQGLITLIVGIGKAFYAIGKAIYLEIRSLIRIFCEVDWRGKLSYLIMGFSSFHTKQYFEAILNIVIEVAFFVFLPVSGITNIQHLITLGGVENNDGIVYLLSGLITVLVIVCFVYLYLRNIKNVYNLYQITHTPAFVKAREDAIVVAESLEDYPEALVGSIRKRRNIFIHKYGFPYLSARYISYLNVFKLKKADNNVVGTLKLDLIKYHHEFDKYNNYLLVTQTNKAIIDTLEKTDEIINAVYSKDQLSVANGAEPLPVTETNKAGVERVIVYKAKDILPRLVGAFNIMFPIATTISKICEKGLKAEASGNGTLRDTLTTALAQYKQDEAEFIRINKDNRLSNAINKEKIINNPDYLIEEFKKGKKVFKEEIGNAYNIDEEDIHDLYMLAKRGMKQGEEAFKEELKLRSEKEHSNVLYYEKAQYHGQPYLFKTQVARYKDEKFATTILAIPTFLAVIVCVLPLIFSILIAFTNYNGAHTTGKFTWSMDDFLSLFGGTSGVLNDSNLPYTFVKLLSWTIIWAILATITCYIFGIILALLINKKGIKLQKMWRTIFVITIAIPQFITLLVMGQFLGDSGALNTQLANMFGGDNYALFCQGIFGKNYIPFLSEEYFAKFIIVVVNMWVGIPYTMLSASGILMNIPEDLYESARIDGAGTMKQFTKITIPYMLFVTGPSLITTFTGNINNFNVIFFLTGGGPNAELQLTDPAGKTDLLITWLYKLTVNKYQYSMGASIGILVFVICSFFSIIMYSKMGSTTREEEFQ